MEGGSGSAWGLLSVENGPLNLPQTGTGGGCPPVIAAGRSADFSHEAVPRQVTHQAVRLQNAAFPEMAFPVGREAGAEVAIVRRFIARSAWIRFMDKLGPAICFSGRTPAGAAPGMAPSAGRRLDFVLPVQLCTGRSSRRWKDRFFWIPVDFCGPAVRRREGRPFAATCPVTGPRVFSRQTGRSSDRNPAGNDTRRDDGIAVTAAAGLPGL